MRGDDFPSGEPGGVIRISPPPLYKGFAEVYEVGRLLAGFAG